MTNNQINSFGTVFISICLKYKKKENKVVNIWSNQKTYNENPHDVRTLYSGILQEKFVDKICREENGEFSIPDIPEELKKCVLEHDLKENSSQVISRSQFFTTLKEKPEKLMLRPPATNALKAER